MAGRAERDRRRAVLERDPVHRGIRRPAHRVARIGEPERDGRPRIARRTRQRRQPRAQIGIAHHAARRRRAHRLRRQRPRERVGEQRAMRRTRIGAAVRIEPEARARAAAEHAQQHRERAARRRAVAPQRLLGAHPRAVRGAIRREVIVEQRELRIEARIDLLDALAVAFERGERAAQVDDVAHRRRPLIPLRAQPRGAAHPPRAASRRSRAARPTRARTAR